MALCFALGHSLSGRVVALLLSAMTLGLAVLVVWLMQGATTIFNDMEAGDEYVYAGYVVVGFAAVTALPAALGHWLQRRGQNAAEAS